VQLDLVLTKLVVDGEGLRQGVDEGSALPLLSTVANPSHCLKQKLQTLILSHSSRTVFGSSEGAGTELAVHFAQKTRPQIRQ